MANRLFIPDLLWVSLAGNSSLPCDCSASVFIRDVDQQAKPCILVVDDDDAFREMVVTVLEREDYEIEAFGDGLSALSAARTRDFSMAIVDVSMPMMNGFDLVRHLRALPAFTDTPIVMLTGAGTENDIVHGFDLGVSDYIVKPFDRAVFVARISRLL